ncbi:MAG: glycosyl transferase [Sphingobacteriaceae bacterium]|nr:MAG: glycosyl transferase [Sphingobacteriaceae bacterium]
MNRLQSVSYTKWLYLFIGVAVVINLSGLFVPIMGPDGTLYATISKTMVQRNNYVELFAFGKDWLDKPHFPFWITALSFKLFGFTTWAYKLPAILFLFGGAYYTYLFAKALYNKQVALWAVLILLTAQHIILSNNDVRAEPYLTGLIIAAVYHFYKSYTPNNFWHLLAGCLFTACAIMTKGMFALIPICGAIFGHFIINRQWKLVFNWRWLVAAILTLIFILPEIYCLYIQFDAHPEKTVFDRQNVSGIKFFFWDSQFGRFFNTGPIKGHGDPSFFIHTTLWAFLPWSLLLFAAIYQFIKQGIKNVQATEWYCICGSLLTFLLFSASKFQLPHYINIVFPFFAIITAQYLYKIKSAKTISAVTITQYIIIVLLFGAIIALQHFFNPQEFSDATRVSLFILFFGFLFLPQRLTTNSIQQIIFRTLLASFVVNLYLNQVFYISLSHYQAGSEAAVWINQNNKNDLPVAQIDDYYATAMEFYSDKPVTSLNPDGTGATTTGQFLLYAPSEVIAGLNAKGWQTRSLKKFDRYWVSRLKPAFLNEATRNSELSSAEVVLVVSK